MNLNADFEERVLLHSANIPWRASPMPGVDRRMLDRIGDEVARATSIVRYAPGSKFSAHTHTGGEEFIVLDGVFQDEHGDYPVGSYVRNPPTSSHTPGSDMGCTIFVKLWQFDLQDRTSVRVNMKDAVKEATVVHLFEDTREKVSVHQLRPGAKLKDQLDGGGELLVIEGTLTESGDVLQKGTWLRMPQSATLSATAGADGAMVWLKTGHLPFAKSPAVSS